MNKSVVIFIISIIVTGLLAYFVTTYFVQIAYVYGESMEPTYENDDIIFINKNYKNIDRNDVVVATKNGIVMVKRVVGVENDKIIIKDGKLYINDKEYKKIDKIEVAGIAEEEIQLGKDEYFVIGDNINKSIDSRYKEVGILKKSDIIATVY